MNSSDFMVGVVLVVAGALACERGGNPDPGRPSFSERAAPVASSAAPVSPPPVDSGSKVASPPAPENSGESAAAAASKLDVKRLLVTTGIKDREPLATGVALPSDGTPIYAFAELANAGESENVRITFERRGGRERVGNVMLPVPGKVSRHRTWANTRFIRAEGVWEAVLWSEAGQELARTSFEVGGASS